MENTNFKVYIEKTNQDYGKLFVEPLERGYGDTLGNALRRLLLSSIKGVAVTAVRIDGVLHEFSTIPGIREDVIEVLMNLKHIPIRAKTETPQLKPEGYKLLTLDTGDLPKGFFEREENPGVITAKDLQTMLWDNDFEFCGDGVLCTLEPNAHLVMEIYIEPGVGYLSAERQRPSHLPIDALLTDAIFSPVKRVNYQIESARVGQSIDYERLIVEVWTNGAVSPEDAVTQASAIARDYFGHIADNVTSAEAVPESGEDETTQASDKVKETVKTPDVKEPPKVVEPEPEPEPELPLPERPVEALGFSQRSANCLTREGVDTVGKLLERSHEDLLRLRNLGKKSIVEIEERLEELGLKLSDVSITQDEPENKEAVAGEPAEFSSDAEPETLVDDIMKDAEAAIEQVAENLSEQPEPAEAEPEMETPKGKSKAKATVKKENPKTEAEAEKVSDKPDKAKKASKPKAKKTEKPAEESKPEAEVMPEKLEAPAEKAETKKSKSKKAAKEEAEKEPEPEAETVSEQPEVPEKPKKTAKPKAVKKAEASEAEKTEKTEKPKKPAKTKKAE